MQFLAGVDPVVAGGATAIVSLLVTVFGYLLKELHRKDDGVWRIVREERRRSTEEMYYRRQAERDAAHWRREYFMAKGMTRDEADRLAPMPPALPMPESLAPERV